MIDKQTIYSIVEQGLQGSDCFLVDISVTPANIISVEIDNNTGVDIERCEKLHRFIEAHLDREVRIVGNDDHLEVWDRATHEARKSAMTDVLADFFGKVSTYSTTGKLSDAENEAPELEEES